MRVVSTFLAAVCLWQTSSATFSSIERRQNDINLKPITDMDLGLQRRSEPKVTLRDSASLFWGNSGNSTSILVNVTLTTGEDEMIVSTDHFKTALTSVSCANDLSLTFSNADTFKAANASWHWVNFNENRTFIMIVNYGNCSGANGRQPWLINWATYDEPKNTVHFNATQRSWEELSTAYTIQWGQETEMPTTTIGNDTMASNSTQLEKRLSLNPEINKNFDINVGHTINKNLYTKTTKQGLGFNVDCENCGTKGKFHFAGHIKTSLAHPLTPKEWTMSVTPQGVGADVNVAFGVSGDLTKPWGEEIQLVHIPISGINIEGVLHVGPEFTLDAGFALSAVSGSATLRTGVSATISDKAVFFVDFLDSSKSKIDGWKPEIKTKPVNVDAEVNGKLELYTQLAANLDCTLFDTKGMGVDLALKLPQVTVEVGAEFNTQGVCPNNKDQFGVKVGGGIGLAISVQAWREYARNKKEVLLTKDLYNNPNLFNFPQLCLPFAAGPKSSIPIKTSGPTKAPSSSVHSTIVASIKPKPTTAKASGVKTSAKPEVTVKPTKGPNPSSTAHTSAQTSAHTSAHSSEHTSVPTAAHSSVASSGAIPSHTVGSLTTKVKTSGGNQTPVASDGKSSSSHSSAHPTTVKTTEQHSTAVSPVPLPTYGSSNHTSIHINPSGTYHSSVSGAIHPTGGYAHSSGVQPSVKSSSNKPFSTKPSTLLTHTHTGTKTFTGTRTHVVTSTIGSATPSKEPSYY